MKRFTMTAVMVAVLCSTVMATLAPWPVQKEYYGVLAHWRMNDNQVAGAVAQYKLDDNAASTTVVNAKGGTNGTWGHGNTDAHDVAAWCTNFGQSLEFDGSNDYINTGQTFQSTFRDSFSISMWVQPHDGIPEGGAQALLGVSDFDGYVTYCMATLLTDGTIGVTYGPSDGNSVTAITAEPVFTDGEQNWHNIVIVFDASDSIVIFVDGVAWPLSAEYAGDLTGLTFSQYTNPHNLYLGVRNTDLMRTFYFDGRMDNIAIYPRVLTAADVAWIATCGTQNTESDAFTVEGSDADGKDLTASVSVSNLTTESGQIGRCLSFDGTNDYASLADDADLDFGTTGDFTISCWVKSSSSTIQQIAYKKQTNSSLGYFFSLQDSGCIRFNVHNGTTALSLDSSGVDVSDGQWHHVAAVRDAGTGRKLFVDGVERGSGSSESYDLANDGAFYVAADKNLGYKFNGSMDDLIVFNRALTATEADAIYDRGTQSEYAREMANPEDDWRFWEDLRMFIWGMRYSISSLPNQFANLDISEFQTGGSEANRAYGIGCLYLVYNGELYVNQVAKAVNTPLSSGLNPSTSGDWYVAASLSDYGNWDKMQVRWFYDGQSWEHGHSFLPTQMNPYCQSAGTKYSDGVQLPTASPVTLTDAIKQEYMDAFESAHSLSEGDELGTTPSSTFETWWTAVVGDAYDIGADGSTQDLDNELFNCNGSVLEFVLDTLGPSSYKWALVTTHPSSETSPDWLAFHPKWWDATLNSGDGGWHLWNEPNDGYVQGAWRRIPLFKESSYTHAATGQSKYWMGDASQEPPGLYGKTLRNRYIRCTYATRNDTTPTAYTSGGATSKTLAQVQTDYDSQYGYYDTTWHNGSVTYNGSQMYVSVESTSDGVFTSEETRMSIMGLELDPDPFPVIPIYRTPENVGFSCTFEQRTMPAGPDSTVRALNTPWDSLFNDYVEEHWAKRVLNPNLSPWVDSGCTAGNEAVGIEAHTTYQMHEDEYRWANPYFSSFAVMSTAITAVLDTTSPAVDDRAQLYFLTGAQLTVVYTLDFGYDFPNQAYVYHYGASGAGLYPGDIQAGALIANGEPYVVVDVPCIVPSYHPAYNDGNGNPSYSIDYPWLVFSASNNWSAPTTYETGVNYTAQDTGTRYSYKLTNFLYRPVPIYPDDRPIHILMSATSPGATGCMGTKDYNAGRASSAGSDPIYTVR